jgi:ribosomal protein S27AE
VLKQLGIGEIKHWDNIQNNRIINQSKMDRPFYEYYDEASFQFVNEWFVQDFKTFQIKRFHTLEAMQSNYKTHPLNVNRPTELYKQMQLNQLYNCGKLKESIQTLETEYANYFKNIKLFYGIKDDDYHFNHGKTIMLEIIRDSQTRVKKIMALPQFEGVIKYIEATNDDFKRKRKKCKLCGNHASQNLLAHIAHSNICKNLRQTVN